MPKSELPTRVSSRAVTRERGLRLTDVPPGTTARVRFLAGRHDELEPEGLREGVHVAVERRIGLGGPIIVRLGRARLAVARNVAAAVLVEVIPDGGEARS